MENRGDWEQILLAGLPLEERVHVVEVIRRTNASKLSKLRERGVEEDRREAELRRYGGQRANRADDDVEVA